MLSWNKPIHHTDNYFFKIYSNIVLPSTPRLPKGLFPADVLVKILKALLPSCILATWHVHLNLLDLITLFMLGERSNYEVPHCGAFSTPHCYTSCAQIFASGTCFQIPLVCIRTLMWESMLHNHIALQAISLFYMLIFKFLERSLEDKSVWTE